MSADISVSQCLKKQQTNEYFLANHNIGYFGKN